MGGGGWNLTRATTSNFLCGPFIGFVETKRGCCGTGLVEVGPTCNVLTPTCHEDSKYLFWDSIHPSEATYNYLAQYLKKEVLPKLYNNHSHNVHDYFV